MASFPQAQPLTRQRYPRLRSGWTGTATAPLTVATIHLPTIEAGAAVSLWVSCPECRAECCTLPGSATPRSTPSLTRRRPCSRSGSRFRGSSSRRGTTTSSVSDPATTRSGNPNRGIDDLGTKVGKGLHCDHGRERNDLLGLPCSSGTVHSIRLRRIRTRRDGSARCANARARRAACRGRSGRKGEPGRFLQELPEPLGRNGHGVGPGSLHLRMPLQVRGTCSSHQSAASAGGAFRDCQAATKSDASARMSSEMSMPSENRWIARYAFDSDLAPLNARSRATAAGYRLALWRRSACLCSSAAAGARRKRVWLRARPPGDEEIRIARGGHFQNPRSKRVVARRSRNGPRRRRAKLLRRRVWGIAPPRTTGD